MKWSVFILFESFYMIYNSNLYIVNDFSIVCQPFLKCCYSFYYKFCYYELIFTLLILLASFKSTIHPDSKGVLINFVLVFSVMCLLFALIHVYRTQCVPHQVLQSLYSINPEPQCRGQVSNCLFQVSHGGRRRHLWKELKINFPGFTASQNMMLRQLENKPPLSTIRNITSTLPTNFRNSFSSFMKIPTLLVRFVKVM